MLITSYITDSFQEYEGCHSFVLFSRGCNLRCCECYNLSEILNPQKNEGQAIDILDRHLTPLHDAVVFLGGEPTIHPDLGLVAKHVKNQFKKTKVYTNGLNPDVVEDLNEQQLIDAYSVDFKTIDRTDILGVQIDLQTYLRNVCKTIDSILKRGIDIELRTTLWTGVNIDRIKKFIFEHYPSVRHIIQKKFDIMHS